MINKAYELASDSETKKILNNAKWNLKSDYKFKDIKDDGQSVFIDNCYSRQQSFGYIDYKDHRKDTLQTIKDLIIKSCHGTQRLHLYKDKDCKIPCNQVICYGYLGGISSHFINNVGQF